MKILVFLLCTLLSRTLAKEVLAGEKLWDSVFAHYDKFVRPSYYNDVPDKVEVTAHVLSMPEIDSIKQELTVNLYFRQGWKDPRVATNNTVENLPSEYWPKLWQPDTFFINELAAEEHAVTVPNGFIRIFPDGKVHKSVRYTIRTSCPMDFSYFPFDTQTCELPIESYGHSAKSIEYAWEKNETSVTVGKISHEEFKLKGTKLRADLKSFTSGTYSSISMEFLFRRNPGRYLTEFFYPCIFLSAVALLAMFAFEEKISVLISILMFGFTVLFLAIASGSMEVPLIAYATALDTYSSITNTFVFLAFLANLISLLLKKVDSGPETFALSNMAGRQRLSNDEEANLCSNSTPTRQHLPPNKLQAVVGTLGNILAKVIVLIKFSLVICYIFTNIIYWSTYPSKTAQTSDDLIMNNWQVQD